MKRVIFFGLALLTTALMVGCSCYPYGYNRSCVTGVCTTGCGGVVDYVDGGPGAGMADCGGGYAGGCNTGCGYNAGSCGTVYNGDCLRCIGNTIRVVGEGALAIAAAPFVLAGHVICSGCNGYESYPNCGCSNEVYYGDNCAQQHDFVDPCGTGSGCNCGATSNSGCSRCSGGFTEGVQPAQVPPNTARRPTNVRTVSHQAPTSCPAHAAPRANNGQVVNGAWTNPAPASYVR